MSEILKLSGGYTAKVCQDESPSNPWKDWDGQPPIMTFNERRIEDYGTGLCLRDLFNLVPLSCFENDAKEALQALGLDAVELKENYTWDVDNPPDNPDKWKDLISENLPETPSGWTEAEEYFDKCEALCRLANIPCHSGVSTGHCQGDFIRVFLAALPSWVETVGIAPELIEENLKASHELYGEWVWGNVYGVSSIRRPDGSEVEDGSCWGFFGYDNEKSGLLEHCEHHVKYDIEWLAKEAVERDRAACADIVTVG